MHEKVISFLTIVLWFSFVLHSARITMCIDINLIKISNGYKLTSESHIHNEHGK